MIRVPHSKKKVWAAKIDIEDKILYSFVSLLFLTFCVFVICTGCNAPEPLPQAEQDRIRIEKVIDSQLPTGAKNVKDLGNGWYTFTLRTDDENGYGGESTETEHTFLWRHSGWSIGNQAASREAITEIRHYSGMHKVEKDKND